MFACLAYHVSSIEGSLEMGKKSADCGGKRATITHLFRRSIATLWFFVCLLCGEEEVDKKTVIQVTHTKTQHAHYIIPIILH